MKSKCIKTTLLAAAITFSSSCGDKKTTSKDHSEHGHEHTEESEHDHAEHNDSDHEGHGEDEGQIKSGPNGGRMIVKANAEFLITNDRKIQITFFDDNGKVSAPNGKTATVITGERPNQVEIPLKAINSVLISEQTLPEGNHFPTAVEIILGDLTVDERFTLNLDDCSGCDNKEYACECDHH